MKIIEQVWNDVKHGKNLDLYITILVASLLVIVDLLGIASIDLTPVVLAVMTLLVMDALGHRHRLGEMLQEISKPEEDFFLIELTNEQQNELNQRVERAKDVFIMGTVLNRTLEYYYDVFEKKLQHGDTIRVVLINPNSPACEMTVKRRYLPTDLQDWRNRVIATLNALEDLKKTTFGRLEIRTIDFHLAYGGILTDMDESQGMIFLWYHSFKTRKTNRPKFILFPENNYWYSYFKEEIGSIWNSAIPRQSEES